MVSLYFFFFSSRRRHTRWPRDWSSDVCSSDLFQHDIHDLVIRRHEGHVQEEVGLGGVVVYLVNQISKHWRHLRTWRGGRVRDSWASSPVESFCECRAWRSEERRVGEGSEGEGKMWGGR